MGANCWEWLKVAFQSSSIDNTFLRYIWSPTEGGEEAADPKLPLTAGSVTHPSSWANKATSNLDELREWGKGDAVSHALVYGLNYPFFQPKQGA